MDARDRFEKLYRAHAGAVRSYAHRRCPADDADDVVAEVFLAAWRRLDEVPADPLPWLLSLARGLLANRHRSGARRAALEARLRSIACSDGATSASEDAGKLDGEALRAFTSLRDDDRELLALVAWEALTREQLAATLGISRGTLAVRLYRARRRLERALAARPGRGGQPNDGARRVEVS